MTITDLTQKIPFKKVRSYLLKTTLFLVLGWILYVQIIEKNDLSQLLTQFKNSIRTTTGWIYLVFAILLVPLNWGLESKKWKVLVNNFQKFTLKESLLSVLSGVSLAIMTPGRIGEYGGRLIGIEKNNWSKALLANLISSLSQNIINIGVGLIASLIFIRAYLPIQINAFLAFTFMATCIITILLLVYF